MHVKRKESFCWFFSLYFSLFSLTNIRFDTLVGTCSRIHLCCKIFQRTFVHSKFGSILRTSFAKIYAHKDHQRNLKFSR